MIELDKSFSLRRISEFGMTPLAACNKVVKRYNDMLSQSISFSDNRDERAIK